MHLLFQMMLPTVSSNTNSRMWPQVVTHDVAKHTGVLKSNVLVLYGEVKGRTLLPFSPQSELATETKDDE